MNSIEKARAEWPPGEWDNEPDELVFELHGLPCIILRDEYLGHLCGYVGVTKLNPLYGCFYDGLPEVIISLPHGGITYAGYGLTNDIEHWFFGFDCLASSDLCPYRFSYREGRAYRNVAYVKAEVEKLAFILFHYEEIGKIIESINNR